MPFAPAPALPLRPGDREALEAVVRKRTSPQRDVLRARIILFCAEGIPHREIKRRLHASIDTILRWRVRYRQAGLSGLGDQPRSGRPPVFSPSRATQDRRARHMSAARS